MPNTLDEKWIANCAWKRDLFKNKVVFATGGAGTICRVQVESMVLLGANAVVLGRNLEKTQLAAREIEGLRSNARVLPFSVDVRDVQTLAKAVQETVEQLGRIDYVIAGAAGNFLSPFSQLSARAFKTVVDIDLIGSFNTAKATFPELRKNKGCIVFVSATLHYRGLPMQSHASAAKAGVDALMRSMAVELGPLGIRSNAIAPGIIGGSEGVSRLIPEGMQQRSTEMVPLGRDGTTEDIANATVFLFGPASTYINGEIMVVDGAQWNVGGSEVSLYPSLVLRIE